MNRSISRVISGLLVFLACGSASAADSFPSKSIRLIIPYPAGGTTDLMARSLQEPLRHALGKPVIVENKPGASGALASQIVAHAAPDGHTIFFTNTGISSVVPFVQKDAGFDPIKDFAAVSLVATGPLVLVANPSAPFNTIKELIDYAKANPGKVEYASAGNGSLGHLSTDLLAQLAGVKLLHVPYSGQAPTTMAVMTGEVKILMTTSSGTMNSYISSGKLKLLGVSTPSKLYPKAQAIADVLPGYSAESWFGITVPHGTPPEVIETLNAAITKAAKSPGMNEKYEAAGTVVTTSSAAQFSDVIRKDVEKWKAIVKASNITAE
jgi:tripartite-type tricarboxylate transporter receptor subunit TctC